LGDGKEISRAFFRWNDNTEIRDELNTEIMKVRDEVRFKAVIPHPNKSTKGYRENFLHSITLL
jgi:hypothetical protein